MQWPHQCPGQVCTWRKGTLIPATSRGELILYSTVSRASGIISFIHAFIIQYMPGTVLDERYNDKQRSTLALAFLKFII